MNNPKTKELLPVDAQAAATLVEHAFSSLEQSRLLIFEPFGGAVPADRKKEIATVSTLIHNLSVEVKNLEDTAKLFPGDSQTQAKMREAAKNKTVEMVKAQASLGALEGKQRERTNALSKLKALKEVYALLRELERSEIILLRFFHNLATKYNISEEELSPEMAARVKDFSFTEDTEETTNVEVEAKAKSMLAALAKASTPTTHKAPGTTAPVTAPAPTPKAPASA